MKSNVIVVRCRTPIHYAVEIDDKCSSTLLFPFYGAGISPRDDVCWTPLHVASYYGVSEGVSSLLDAGAKLGALDRREAIPLARLFERAYFRRIWVVQELVVSSKAVVRCGSLTIR